MSLQVWLPLNGDLHNQGLSNVTVTNNGATVDNNGKIGKCYNIDNSSLTFTNPLSSTCSEFSVCGWVNLNSNFVKNNGLHIISWGGTYSRICISKDGGAVKVLLSNTAMIASNTLDTAVIAGEWNHYVVTFKNGTLCIYINGILDKQIIIDSTSITFASNLVTIGNYSSEIAHGKINDFRLYNHALSPKEVKEISKGLILHYKLNDTKFANANLISDFDTSFLTYSDGTISMFSNQMNGGIQEIVSNINGAKKCLHLHCNSGSSNRQYKTLSVSQGKTYTISADYYSLNAQNPAWRGELNGGNYSWLGASSAYTTPGKWQRLSYTYSNLTSNATIYFFIYCNAGDDCYVKNIKIEEGSEATPWIPNLNSVLYPVFINNLTAIQDTSGYNNNGTITGSLVTDFFSSKYNCALYFEDYTRYISCLINNDLIPTAITMSCWVKSNNTSPKGGYHIPLNMHGTNFEISVPSNGKARLGYVIGGTRYVSDVGSGVLDGNWHMLTSTFDGTTICRYIDGVLINSETRTGALTAVQTLGVGNFPAGTTYGNTQMYESDIRIYTTALSADGIKELYNTSKLVDSQGNKLAREVSSL